MQCHTSDVDSCGNQKHPICPWHLPPPSPVRGQQSRLSLTWLPNEVARSSPFCSGVSGGAVGQRGRQRLGRIQGMCQEEATTGGGKQPATLGSGGHLCSLASTWAVQQGGPVGSSAAAPAALAPLTHSPLLGHTPTPSPASSALGPAPCPTHRVGPASLQPGEAAAPPTNWPLLGRPAATESSPEPPHLLALLDHAGGEKRGHVLKKLGFPGPFWVGGQAGAQVQSPGDGAPGHLWRKSECLRQALSWGVAAVT